MDKRKQPVAASVPLNTHVLVNKNVVMGHVRQNTRVRTGGKLEGLINNCS